MSDTNNTAPSLEKEKLSFRKVITLMLQGAIIGAGGILPGVSGGILCVAFGLYMPLMQLFANPLKEIPKTWKKWMFVGIGGCIGLFVFAKVLSILFATSETVAKSLFAGLIAGTLPSLFREAANDPKAGERKVSDKQKIYKIIALFLGFVFSMALFVMLEVFKQTATLNIAPGMFWFGVCGFIIGMGFTIPGLTSSTVLIFLGLLQPMLEGATNLDFAVIIPVGIGVVWCILLLSRLVNFIFGRWYTVAFYVVIGMIFASTLAIIPRSYTGIAQIIFCICAAIAGAAIALVLDKVLSGYEK